MSGYTTSSELSAKSHGRKSPLSQGQEPPWAFLPLAYRASATASAMSGQFPPPSSASPPIPYTAHHLPPAAPTPGQYPPAPTQRLRVPTLGSSPPPAQGHIPPWGQNPAGHNSLPGNLGYFGPPHIGGLGGPGRGQPQPWQSGPKPTTHPVERNPLFSLQMLVSQEATSAGGAVPGIRPADDYQQETIDLSSHSGSTTIDDHLSTVRKDNLRNGGIVSNGEIGYPSDERKSPAKPPESVSVIAHNPLRETQESVIGTVLNCSSKSELKPMDVVMECSSTVKNLPESPLVADRCVVPSLGTQVEIKPIVMPTSTIVDKSTVPASVAVVDKQQPTTVPSTTVNSERPISSSPSLTVEKIIVPSSGSAVENPRVSSVPSKVADNWEGSNHTPDNVESILEDMFQTQEEKSNSSGALPLVVPQSVIVTNESRGSVQADSLSKINVPVDKPASPEKINEQKLAEILKVEEPDVEMVNEIKPDVKEVIGLEKEEAIGNNEKAIPSKDVKGEVSSDVKEENKSFGENVSLESTSSEDVKPVLSESEDKMSQSPESSSLQPSVKQLVGVTPDTPTSSSAPIETEGIESAKNAFIEVESELEKMFAGIVEPGSEMPAGLKMEPSSSSMVAQQSGSNFSDRKKLMSQDKKRGRPKGTQLRRGSDSVFSSDSCSSSKKKQKRPSDSDKRAKKTKYDSGRDSPVIKKGGRGSFVKDASNDSATTVGIKSRGPLIHVEGSKDNPISVIVVNSGVRTSEEDENTEKIAKPPFRKKKTYQEGRASKLVGSGLYNSTLSARYDSHTPDATWICVFCKRGPHCDGGLGGEPVGDLFGPYVISSGMGDSDAPSRGVPTDKDVVEEQKRRGGGKQASLRATGCAEQFVQKIARKHKRSMSADSDSGLAGLVAVAGEKNEYEVWMHEHCAVWAPGMYLIGSNLIGLQEAVWASVKMLCSKCGEPGASISCVTRGCSLVLHYSCAVVDGWQLDTDTFIAKCRNHIRGAGFFTTGAFIRQS